MSKPTSKPTAAIAALVVFLNTTAAFAQERTLTLHVQNMDCAICPHTVKASLEAVPGVAKVVVSFRDKTAIVTYDDSKIGVDALTNATTEAGYPSTPKG